MRRIALVLIASTAFAAPKPRVTWADWVGDYAGTLAWTGCSAPGNARATIAIDATDGALAVTLARAADWLPVLSLVEEDNGTLAGVEADLSVVLARPKPNAIDVAIDLDSGCRARGRLVRATTTAACDRLVAWARVEARCTKLSGPPLEPKLGKLDRCDARAAALETELVDAGCAPDPDPLLGVRGRACASLATAADRLSRCTAISADTRNAFVQYARGHVTGAQHAADAASLAEAERHCATVRDVIRKVLTEHRCL